MFEIFDVMPTSNARGEGRERHPISQLVDEVLFRKTSKPRRIELDGAAWLPIGPDHHGGVAVTLYRPGKRRLRAVRTGSNVHDTLRKALVAARRHERFREFSEDCRITIDFFGITGQPIRFRDLQVASLASDRFEFGVDGLCATVAGKRHYFLPGDSYVRSIYGLNALTRHLSRMTGADDIADCVVHRLRSTSIVSYEDRWLRLYRGHPVYAEVTVDDVKTVCNRAIDHIVEHQRSDGRFLYYYDAAKDSEVDHEHPKHDERGNPYYNELRHCGGIITLLLATAIHGRDALQGPVEAAIEFLIRNSVVYSTPDGAAARHIIFNRKSKLGGSGLALYVLAFYQKVYESEKYRQVAHEFANHLRAEILPSGEFRYYHVYLDEYVSAEDNQKFFSFYYPGEALIGLAAYLKWVNSDHDRHQIMAAAIRSAVRFLLIDRPLIHRAHYAALPSDAWLMAAINELADIPGLDDPEYAAFVFENADTMLSLMYTRKNALYPDYIGAFYYKYGDLPYADGARCEGLVAALELAIKRDERDRACRYAGALVKTIRATIRLANTPESVYFAPNPEKAVGCIRFKLTRQWSRIDTMQHVVCYYLRFLAAYDGLVARSIPLDDRLAERRAAAGTAFCRYETSIVRP